MILTEVLGFAVGLVRWRLLGRGQRSIAIWLGAAAGFDVAQTIVAPIFRNVQPIAHFWFPVSLLFAIGALASYQPRGPILSLFRGVTVGYLAVWLVLLLTVESLLAYGTYSAPLHGVLVLACAAMVLVRRGAIGRGDMLVDPAFLIAAGLCGYSVAVVFESLVAQLFFVDHPDYIVYYFSACNALMVVAQLVIVRALFLSPSAPRTAR